MGRGITLTSLFRLFTRDTDFISLFWDDMESLQYVSERMFLFSYLQLAATLNNNFEVI